MKYQIGKKFFDELRRSIRISYFVSSLLPILFVLYLIVLYVYPLLLKEGSVSTIEQHIGIMVCVAVLSFAGLALSTKAISISIFSLRDLNIKLNNLIEITKQIRGSVDINLLLDKIVTSSVKLCSAEAGSLLLLDDNDNLRFKVVKGPASNTLSDRVIKLGQGISGWVAETGETLRIKPERHDLVQGSDLGSGGLIALSQTGG